MLDPPVDGQPIAADDRLGQSLWRHADFVKLWVGQTISLFGSRFTALAVQFIGAVTLHASALDMGVLAALGSAPSLVVGLFAGAWIDRHRCRPILIAADIGRALLLATIPVAALTGVLTLDLLYVVSFLVGVMSVFFDLAYQSYLPTLVERGQLVEGNSKLVVSSSIATVAGLSVAGVVIQAITAPLAVALDAFSYVASFVSILLIRQREKEPDTVHAPLLTQVREGIGEVLGNSILLAFAGCLGTSNFTSSIFFALYILYGTRELGLGAAALGVVYGIGVIGGIVGGILAPGAAARVGIGGAIVGGAFLGSTEVAPAVFATAETAVPLLLLSSVLGNFGWTVYGVNATSLRQAITPRSLLGRMNATLSFLEAGMIPLGGLVGGALGQALGVREAIALAAIGSVLSFLWVVFSPVRGSREFRSRPRTDGWRRGQRETSLSHVCFACFYNSLAGHNLERTPRGETSVQSEIGSATNGRETTGDDNRRGDQSSSGVSLLDVTLSAATKDRQTVNSDGTSVARLAEGVSSRSLPTHSDARGSVVEMYDARWGWHPDPVVFVYSFTLRPGYVKGWNLHKLHEDRYVLLQGEMELVLYDVRPSSSTYGQISKLVVSEFDRRIVSIPCNVWHADHNIGTKDAVAVNFPTLAYEHADPDKYRLPIGTTLIPYQFADAQGW